MQQDLNDFQFFVQVVDQGGFAPAGRALGIPKSRLSRRIALLEERLGVRLIQRSSRHFAVTDIGQEFLRHCRAMMAEAQAAQAAIEHIQSEPRGPVRVSCPIALAQTLLAVALPEFMRSFPEVSITLEATNRRVDVIEEGIDIALRARTIMEDSALVVRSFGYSCGSLFAAPSLLDKYPLISHPAGLTSLPSLGMPAHDGKHRWSLTGPDGSTLRIEHQPRLITDDMVLLKVSAVSALGLVALPDSFCHDELLSGHLVKVLPRWTMMPANVHAVFASRRGLVPAVRALIDFLAIRLPQIGGEFGIDRPQWEHALPASRP